LTVAPPPMARHEDDNTVSSASVLIQHRLVQEPQYQAVLQLVNKYLNKFDEVNMATALHVCAKTAKEHELLKRQILGDANFVRLFHATKEKVLNDVSSVSPRTTSDILWSCSTMSIIDSDLFNQITADATTRMAEYSATGIAMLVHSLGVVQHKPRAAFMQALVRELRTRLIHEFSPRCVVMLVYGMMRLGIRDDRLMRLVQDYVVRTQSSEWDHISVSLLGFAFSKLEYFDDAAMAILGKQVLAELDQLNPRQINMVLMTFAKCSGQVEGASVTMGQMVEGVKARLPEFDNRAVATFAFAVGKWRQLADNLQSYSMERMNLTDDEELGRLICDTVLSSGRSLWSFPLTHLVQITYGMMRMNYRNPDFLLPIAEQLMRRSPELTCLDIVNAVYCLARVEFVHVGFLIAMIDEVKRRDLLKEMTHWELATFMYSLAICRVRDDSLVNDIVKLVCSEVRSMEPQSVSMILWSCAVLNVRDYAEPLASACLEDMSLRIDQYAPCSIACVFWAAAVVSGSSSALWMLQSFFSKDFWKRDFADAQYTMFYAAMVSMQVEEGLKVEEMRGFRPCEQTYQMQTGEHMATQNARLSARLRVAGVTHEANQIVPALPGYSAPGIRGDIVIESMRVVIEIEGPQRMTVPLDALRPGNGDSKEDSFPMDIYGRPEEVIMRARVESECPLTGSAAFKRRLLRKCGWVVVTITFDDNEDYLADILANCQKQSKEKLRDWLARSQGDEKGSDSLTNIFKGSQGMSDASAPSEAREEPTPELQTSLEEASRPLSEKERLQLEKEDYERALKALKSKNDLQGAEIRLEEDNELSEAEQELRRQHAVAMQELQRRITEERSDAAGTKRFGSHLDYRQWQVEVEKDVLRKVVEAL